MAKATNVATEQRWRQLIQQQQASPLGIRAFCRQRGLPESSFHFWRRELLRRDQRAAQRPAPAFVPVELVPRPDTSAPARPAAALLEVMLPGGLSVRVAAGFDDTTLRQLLALLREPLC